MESKDYLDVFRGGFIQKMSLLTWEAAQWLQYVGYEFNKDKDLLRFKFKTSTYGIQFHLEQKAFSNLYGEPAHIPFNKTYEFFRTLKYAERSKIKTMETIKEYGLSACERAYNLHVHGGNGAMCVAYELLSGEMMDSEAQNIGDRLIDAGRHLKENN